MACCRQVVDNEAFVFSLEEFVRKAQIWCKFFHELCIFVIHCMSGCVHYMIATFYLFFPWKQS